MQDIIAGVRNLTHEFQLNKKLKIRAIDGLSLDIRKGEILGVVGESGSGKSTLARCMMNIYRPTEGEVFFKNIKCSDKAEYKKHAFELQTKRQIIFQDSASSLNPRMRVIDIIAEPFRINHIVPIRGSIENEARFQLKYTGMDEELLYKYPGELSGGQRQRVAIARALAMEPELLVADEPISAVDVSIQAQLVNLFKHLRNEHGFSIMFIAHDLAMVEFLCDRVAIMYRGRLVELAETKELFANPLHPYTKLLLSCIPIPDPRAERERKHPDFDETEFDTSGCLTEISEGHLLLCGGEKSNNKKGSLAIG